MKLDSNARLVLFVGGLIAAAMLILWANPSLRTGVNAPTASELTAAADKIKSTYAAAPFHQPDAPCEPRQVSQTTGGESLFCTDGRFRYAEQAPVRTLVELPFADNRDGDVRKDLATGHRYIWDGEGWLILEAAVGRLPRHPHINDTCSLTNSLDAGIVNTGGTILRCKDGKFVALSPLELDDLAKASAARQATPAEAMAALQHETIPVVAGQLLKAPDGRLWVVGYGNGRVTLSPVDGADVLGGTPHEKK